MVKGILLLYSTSFLFTAEGQSNITSRLGGGNDLPKFKFSFEFPIGLKVILQLQIKKFKLPTILKAKLF